MPFAEQQSDINESLTQMLQPKRNPHRVLLVDDDPQIRRALKRTLRNEPYDLLFTDSGSKALAILAEKNVQVYSTVGKETTFEIRLPALPKHPRQPINNDGKQS